MAKCDACGTTILFGGKKQSGLTFCNDKCLFKGVLALTAHDLPLNVVEDEVKRVHGGPCPICSGAGPVDLRFYHQVWSVIYLCSHKSAALLGCARCGRKKQVFSLFFSLFLGWWSIPWGLIYTPVQIFRNLKALLKPLNPAVPSQALIQMVKLDLAQQMLSAQGPAVPVPPIASPFGDSRAPALPPRPAAPPPIASPQAPSGNPFSNQDAFKS